MTRSHHQKSSELGSEELGRLMIAKKVVKVYCINFIAALMLRGGEQRPQVYAELLVPNLGDVEHALTEKNTFLGLHTDRERTGRFSHMPNVLFIPIMACFLKFYFGKIRLVLNASTGSNEAGTRYRRLLLDT